MARLQIDDSIGCGMSFLPGQLFVFGSITLHADSAGRLGQIETFTPGRIVRFGNLEYAADPRGELVFSGWVSDQARDPTNTSVQISELTTDQDHGMELTSDPASSTEPNATPSEQASNLTEDEPEAAIDRTSGRLQLGSTYNQVLGKGDQALLNEMLDRIQSLAISDDHDSAYDQIWEKPKGAGIFSPPTTHLVATVEDLTDVLASASEEATDMDEDIGETSDTASPPAVKNTGRWTATSTYDVYMVDTPKGEGGGPPKRRRKGRHNGGTGNGDTNNDGTTTGDNGNGDAADEGLGDGEAGADNIDDNNRDDDDPEDDDYDPEIEEEQNLGPEDYDALKRPLGEPQLDTVRKRLASMAKSIKHKSQRLKAEEDYLNDRWTELLTAEEALKGKLRQDGPSTLLPPQKLAT